MSSDLRSLADIISSSVANILRTCEETGQPFPSLDEPVKPSDLDQGNIRSHPSVARSIRLVVAAATQLIAVVQFPPLTLTTQVTRYTFTAALGIAAAGNIAEILRDIDPSKGMYIEEIAKKSDMAPKKLSRVLRLLAMSHWFREVRPDCFANNSLSSLLDAGKLSLDGSTDGSTRSDFAGFSEYVSFCADECLKAASHLVETMTDPHTKFSEEPNCSALQRALNTSQSLWEYYDSSKGRERCERFAVAMAGAAKRQPPEPILTVYDWNSLEDDAFIVDVGSGLGQVSIEILKIRPDLRVLLEDRPLVVEQAKKYWERHHPSLVVNSKVTFIGTDFFEPQPELPGPPDVFLLRMVVHDWSDKYAVVLLRRLCDAAKPETKLIIIDSVLNFVCDSDRETPPSPLLPNMGGANILPYNVDVQVFGLLNAGERTVFGFKEILSASGWEIQEIRRSPTKASCWASIICTPIVHHVV